MESQFDSDGLFIHRSSIWNDSKRRNLGTSDSDKARSNRFGYDSVSGLGLDGAHTRSRGIGYEEVREFSESSGSRVPAQGSKMAEDLPLISTEVLDSASQRALAFAIFVIIQSYKLYDLILLKTGMQLSGIFLTNSRLNFISKYIVIDSLFFYCLPAFKIPKLRFKPFIVFIQIILCALLTIFLSSEQNMSLLTVVLALWKKYHARELSLTGDSISHKRALDSSSHFKGAHTIKILPENTAYFNPHHSSFCLPLDGSSGGVFVPVRVNSTSTIDIIQLEHRDIQTNEIELWNLTKNQLYEVKGSSLGDSWEKNIHIFSIPLKKTGVYQIKKVIDTKNIALKTYKSQLVLPNCPSASIQGKGPKNRCVSDLDEVSIQVQGVPPLKLSYTKIINGDAYKFEDTSLQPEYFESPLLSSSKYFSDKDLSELQWARSYPVDIFLETELKQHGNYLYSIERVVDGLGNTVEIPKPKYSGIKDSSPNIHHPTGWVHQFDVHELPRASLDEKAEPNSPVRKSLVVKLDVGDFVSDGPFTALFSFEDSNSHISTFEKQFNENIFEVPISEPGIYNLLSIRSSFCHGAVVGKSSALVTKPVPPKVSVNSTPILDQCIGQVGLNFDLTFTGIPPFYYKAKIFKITDGNKRLYDSKKFTSQGTRNQFTYTPKSEGNYEIVFTELSNELFTNPIHLDSEEFTFKTSMRVKPAASISGNYVSNLCLGGSTKVPIKFSGEPPFTLNYDIVETFSNKRTSYNVENVNEYAFDIETPKFNVGGEHILSLVSVKDSSGCLVALSDADARIKVRRDIPSASFAASEAGKVLKIKEGSFAELPLKLSGEGPFTVTYEHMDKHGKVLSTEMGRMASNYKPVLRVQKEGIYKLVGVQDSSCIGKISSDNFSFRVSYLEKPSFSLIQHSKVSKMDEFHYSKKAVCKGLEETVDLSLRGVPPFLVEYETTSSLGDTTSNTIQVATKYASLKFPTEKPGEYVIKIKGVYDANYQKKDFSTINYSVQPIFVKQVVNSLPYIEFVETGKAFRTCSANVNQKDLLEPIKLKLVRGTGPYSITFSVYHESSSRTDRFTIDEVSTENFDYTRLYEGLALGNHIVTIEGVTDANGCSDEGSVEREKVLISITDVPRISIADSTVEYCVGDYVGYQLNGVAPFTINYNFNGMNLKSTERTSQFVRFASEPGKISIMSIQDSSSQCIVNFTTPNMKTEFERLALLIHPIPSVTVSQGQELVEDIHEGDKAEVIFSFEGTPPFSLTYVRTENIQTKRGRKPQIVETHKVSDIYAYEYRVITSLQGTYEALEVSDAFCSAKNEALLIQ